MKKILYVLIGLLIGANTLAAQTSVPPTPPLGYWTLTSVCQYTIKDFDLIYINRYLVPRTKAEIDSLAPELITGP